MRLYIKPGCPWCVDAEVWLKAEGYRYKVLNVSSNVAAFAEMSQLSGQSKVPTIEVEGFVLGDFDTDQLEDFLDQHGITAESTHES